MLRLSAHQTQDSRLADAESYFAFAGLFLLDNEMAKPKLTESDFQKAAKKLRCDVAAIRAVDEVESKGEGFYPDGFPTILFERHKFRQFTKGKYNASHPHLSGAAGNYGKAGQNQRNKFNEAFALNPVAAMKSCSWGRYQIMGFNHAVCGFATVNEFVDAMKESEGRQLDAFVNFVINNGLADELRNLNWASFARGYNGAAYKKNNYDLKMAKAYAKYKKIGAGSPSSSGVGLPEQPALLPSVNPRQEDFAETETIDQVREGDSGDSISDSAKKAIETEVKRETSESGEQTMTVTAERVNEQDVNVPAVVTEPEPQGFSKKLAAGIASVFGGTLVYDSLGKFAGIQFSAQAIYIIVALLVIAFLGFVVWAVLDFLKKQERTRLEFEANTAIDRKNIVWAKPAEPHGWMKAELPSLQQQPPSVTGKAE